MTQSVSSKSKGTALILAIFLGELGIHRFCLGYTGMGILYLLTAGLFGIGWIVDIIKLISGSMTDADGNQLAS